MSESQEASRVDPAFDGIPIYRVTLVRESTVAELPTTPVRKATEAAAILRPLFAGLDREQFVVLLLDAQHSPIGINIVSIGSLTASVVHPRESFKAAILANAAAVIIAHNHPSNSVEPSREDVELTRRLREAGELLGIRVLDSLVLGEGDSLYSFVDAGRW
jgi:DNA repair protein RadC